MANLVNVVLMTNYRPDAQHSMLRFSSLLIDHGKSRNIRFIEMYPIQKFNFTNGPKLFKKWLGYIDKFIIFPRKQQSELKEIIKDKSKNLVLHITDHSNSLYIPKIKQIPTILTCHDLIAIRSALGHFPFRRLSKSGGILQKMILSAIPRADFIACDSHNTESDLLKICPETNGRTSTIYLGIKKNVYFTVKPSSPTMDPGSTPFILHVGNSAWYKNRKSVLESFFILTQNKTNENLHLVLVGNPPTKEETANLCRKSQSLIENKIHIYDNLTDSELCYLYERACVLIFPSLIEGFGWPPLEAQSFGCPVISSSEGSLSEILSNSTLTVNPNDTEEIARKTRHLLENQNLNEEIVRKGRKNATRFPIEDTVKNYLDLYVEVLERAKA